MKILSLVLCLLVVPIQAQSRWVSVSPDARTIVVDGVTYIEIIAGDLQFDIVSDKLFIFGDGGVDGIQIDANSNRIRGASAGDHLDLDEALWQTQSSNMKIDPDVGSVGILTLGDTGDNDTTEVIGSLRVITSNDTMHYDGFQTATFVGLHDAFWFDPGGDTLFIKNNGTVRFILSTVYSGSGH